MKNTNLDLDLDFDYSSLSEKNDKRIHYAVPTFKIADKVKKDMKEWNTIKHVYRYQTLYKICNKLFELTNHKKLACLNYYIEVEEDENYMYAMDINYMKSPIYDRIKRHIDILRRVYNNDTTLKYDENKKGVSERPTLFG